MSDEHSNLKTSRLIADRSVIIDPCFIQSAPAMTLGALNLFDLSDGIRQLIVQHGFFRHLPLGAILVTEDGPSEQLHFVETGWTYRYNTTRDGARQIIGVGLPGDFCNLDVLGSPTLSYAIRTRTPATIISLPRPLVLSAMERSTEVAAFFRRAMSIENAITGRLVMTIGRKPARARLAHFMCEVAARLGRLQVSMEDQPFTMALTQEDIGDVLGLTPVHICRMVKSLKADRVIDWTGHKVRIRDVAALIRIAEFDDRYLQLAAPKQGDRPPDQRSFHRQPEMADDGPWRT